MKDLHDNVAVLSRFARAQGRRKKRTFECVDTIGKSNLIDSLMHGLIGFQLKIL